MITLKKNSKLYGVWLIMMLCILVGVITTNILSIVALGIFAIYAILAPISNSCVLLFGLIPVASIFKYQAGVTSFFTICELLVVLVAILKDEKIKWKFLISLLLLSVCLLIVDFPHLNVLGIIKIIVGFYLIYLVTSKSKQQDIINIAYLLSASTIITLLLSMSDRYFSYIEPYMFDVNYLAGKTSGIIRNGGFLGDPNYCGLLIIITVALLCVLYYHKKIKMEFWVLLALLIPLGFFTYSKSYFLCISVLILFLIFFILLPKSKWLGIGSIFLVLIVGAVALSGKIGVINLILERFSSGDITTGRMDLNKLYLNYIFDNPMVFFFGEGISTERIVGASNNVHNIYIEALFKLGSVGCVLYLSTLLFSVTSSTNRKGNRPFVNFFPLIFLLVLYLALAGINMYEFPFYLSIAFSAMNFNLPEKNEITKENLIRSGRHYGNKKI